MTSKPVALPLDLASAYLALLAEREALQIERDVAVAEASNWQADCYNGFEPLFDPRMKALPITPAFCFAHARPGFFELADIEKTAREGKKGKPVSPIALEAVRRLDALSEIERDITTAAQLTSDVPCAKKRANLSSTTCRPDCFVSAKPSRVPPLS
jgi:hypothetical protein